MVRHVTPYEAVEALGPTGVNICEKRVYAEHLTWQSNVSHAYWNDDGILVRVSKSKCAGHMFLHHQCTEYKLYVEPRA